MAVVAAESLPLPDNSIDALTSSTRLKSWALAAVEHLAVIANHMLYHIDRDVVLPEIRRILRPDGRLLATTNGESNMHELRELHAATTEHTPSDSGEFTLENGPEQLTRHFDTVHRYERESVLRVPDLEPLVAHTASLSGVGESQVADFAELATKCLTEDSLKIQKSMGLLVGEMDPAR